ncbi:carbohydrate binding domain-containing protein [Alkalihalobacillus sp. LMS39]|uniref:carbohydrate binding domain-containing protein n=1 Tax=Alkalihalobacillus sp. LMS39 TaxID=2924032 RepID=UPI001FB2FBED|nr:carbohydrate binding domain-containing protein [Alkalihalobacillus sp. LMS39]UOE92155.1 alpha-amylase family glycosyl hydrolase [Alkalihalobacillus sp. LMS39]
MNVVKNRVSMCLFFVFVLVVSSIMPYVQPSNLSFVQAAEQSDNFTWDNATVYFAMTDRFNDGNPSNNNSYGRPQKDAWGQNIGTFHGGDLQGLTDKLNEGYFTDLGINAIWITAPYEQIHGWVGGGSDGDFAHYAFHGYYALDYTTVDQNMGTVEEMREFVDTAHENGIRVVLDVVMNHPGYNTLKDMEQYGFGTQQLNSSWTPGQGQTWHSHHEQIDYNNSNAWRNWWGNWIRADIGGYERCGNSEITMCLAGLPDFRTELTHSVGLPPLLQTKWQQESNGFDNWIVPAASDLRQDLGIAPADYIVKWLSAWVEEFGIDGFRVDTAKHVEMDRWDQLKQAANEALWTWRENNPDKPGANWDDDFWMVAEVWGHGVGRSSYFDNGFDSVINFTFQGEHGNGPAYNLATMESTFSRYARDINSDPTFNVLSYISQHDTMLYPRNRLLDGGTYLMLLPGAVQVFYGDETARPFGPTGSDSHQGTRSSMNWDSINEQVLEHWQKMGQFRNNHVSIGAGSHQQIGSSPYTFSRVHDDDRVVVSIGANGSTTIDVSSVFNNGVELRDFYTGQTATVSNGHVTFEAHANGVVLIEEVKSELPILSANPGGGEFDTEEIDVELTVSGAEQGYYTIDGSEASGEGIAFTDGDVISIGANLAVNESLTLKLFAENELGIATEEYTFTKTPAYVSVSATPPGGTFTTESVEITLKSKNTTDAYYSIDGSNPKDDGIPYENGETIVIGEESIHGDEITLRLWGQNEYGDTEEQYTYTKIEGLTIHFKKPSSWGQPQLYYYGTNPTVTEPTWANAPNMEHSGGDWYQYTISGVEEAFVIFKDNQGNQTPGRSQPGYFRDKEGWYDGSWHNQNPEEPTKPNTPQNIDVHQVTDTSAVISWDVVAGVVEGYRLYDEENNIVQETTNESITLEDLTSETDYSFTVTAFNLIGESDRSEKITFTTKGTNIEENEVTIYYNGFESPYIHYKPVGGSWTTAPGEAMSPSDKPGFSKITINVGDAEGIVAAFNNGHGQWDNNQGRDYTFGLGTFTVMNGKISEGEPTKQFTQIYYHTGWSNPHIHYAINGGQWTQSPGVRMQRSSEHSGYSVVTIDLGSQNGLTAVFNNGSGQWDNNQGRNYQFGTGVYTLSSGRIVEGTPK